MMTYDDFLATKQHSSQNFGIKPVWLPDFVFDFQNFANEKLIFKGRGAGFLDTGLGKTLIELIIATNYIRVTNKRTLIICPLAVAFQFIKEAEKFGIDDVSYSKDGKLSTKIIICNYERLHLFNPGDYECVICDESSILKNFKGATKGAITTFIKKIKYRYLFTATPAPNDFIEIGTSSEALGYLGYTDMLTKFFTNNEDTISPQNIGTEWLLKGHAKIAFFKWISSFSISARKPSDLGPFDDTKYILPELITEHHSVKNDKNSCIKGQFKLFNMIARTQSEIQAEQRDTIENRCIKAVELSHNHRISAYWCNLNDEADMLVELDRNAVQISGSQSLERKEELLLAFAAGEIEKFIIKPQIGCFGLNWQHCDQSIVFPTFSWERYYQLVRRSWRFGRIGKVYVDNVYSDGQKRVLDVLTAKMHKSNELFDELNKQVNQQFEIKKTPFDKQITLPKFI